MVTVECWSNTWATLELAIINANRENLGLQPLITSKESMIVCLWITVCVCFCGYVCLFVGMSTCVCVNVCVHVCVCMLVYFNKYSNCS